VWGHPNIVAVLARSGFGTIWKALLNQKPIGVISALSEDDPEIYHNAQVVKASGIGTILDDSLEPLVNALPQYLSKIQEQLKIENDRFKTIDGIKYTSAELKQLVSRVKTGG
jgi:UDP-N-acetylglucosamine:LPS N-acetylglucosamine transferase